MDNRHLMVDQKAEWVTLQDFNSHPATLVMGIIEAYESAKQSNKHPELKIGSWHSPHNTDGGCQMPYQVIKGYCCVCGTPNRSCQPEKQPTKTPE